MMHVLDYDRALGDLLELDDTIRASIARIFKFPYNIFLGSQLSLLQTSRRLANSRTLLLS